MRIFVAGASGAIGVPLVRELIRAGHTVIGMAHSEEEAQQLREQGSEVALADALDASAVESALRFAQAEIVIDQLTSLPKDPADFAASQPRDENVRIVGGGDLFRAANALGIRRYLQQSSGFFLKADTGLADENAPLFVDASPGIAASARMYSELEARAVSSPLEAVILRYGFFYGPGTWYEPHGGYGELSRRQKLPLIGEGQAVWSWVHIDDAAKATVAALDAPSGVYNIVDSDPCRVSVWMPAFAASVGALPPPRISEEEAQRSAGADAVFYATHLVGATNAKAKRILNFQPRRLEWLTSYVPGTPVTAPAAP